MSEETEGAVDAVGVEDPITPRAQLQAEFAEAAKVPRLFKRLPARSGKLFAEYKPIPLADAKAAIKSDQDPDLLIAALLRILREDESHEWSDATGVVPKGLVPLGIWSGTAEEDPYRFDHRLCELLGIAKGSSHQIALSLFEGNDLALATQAGELGQWSTNTRSDALQDFQTGS